MKYAQAEWPIVADREVILSFSSLSLIFLDFKYSVPIVNDCPLSTVLEYPILSNEKILFISILLSSLFKFFILFGLYLSDSLGVK